MGGAHNAHIHSNFLAAAHALNGPLLEKSQQLGLQRKRQIADFIEHQSAAVGHLDLAQCGLDCARECTFLKPEQFAFQQVLGNRGAIDSHEFLSPTR